jgi:hypothetical protein
LQRAGVASFSSRAFSNLRATNRGSSERHRLNPTEFQLGLRGLRET